MRREKTKYMFLNEGVLSIISIIIPVYTQMCALWLVEDRFISLHLARGDHDCDYYWWYSIILLLMNKIESFFSRKMRVQQSSRALERVISSTRDEILLRKEKGKDCSGSLWKCLNSLWRVFKRENRIKNNAKSINILIKLGKRKETTFIDQSKGFLETSFYFHEKGKVKCKLR